MAFIRVVVADSSEGWRSAACSFLEQVSNIRIVGIAADGTEVLQLVRKLRPDVVLMDVNLPNLTPFEASKVFGRENITTKLVIVTFNSDVHVMNSAIAQGVSGYVHKSDFGTELGIALRIVMNGKSFVSTQMCNSVATMMSHFANSQ